MQAKLHLSSTVISKISLFGHAIYTSALLLKNNQHNQNANLSNNGARQMEYNTTGCRDDAEYSDDFRRYLKYLRHRMILVFGTTSFERVCWNITGDAGGDATNLMWCEAAAVLDAI